MQKWFKRFVLAVIFSATLLSGCKLSPSGGFNCHDVIPLNQEVSALVGTYSNETPSRRIKQGPQSLWEVLGGRANLQTSSPEFVRMEIHHGNTLKCTLMRESKAIDSLTQKVIFKGGWVKVRNYLVGEGMFVMNFTGVGGLWMAQTAERDLRVVSNWKGVAWVLIFPIDFEMGTGATMEFQRKL